MSYINFESARVKEELRNEKRKAREAVLEKAEADYKRRKEREQRASERGEDKWMLPSLDAQLQPDSQKKKKKHKKEKKKKKEKKHKKKKKHDSSDSDASSESDEWIEKGTVPPQTCANSGPAQRDEWMTLPALFPSVSRDQIRAQKRQEAPQDEETLKKKFLLDNPGQSERELNPFWKDGGKGLPQVEEPIPESLSLAANSTGDHGLAWLRRAMHRVQEQAKEQGRSEEAVAAERWGSLEKLKSMLAEAERRCRTRPRDRGRGRGGPHGGRVQGPVPKPREYEDWREDPTAGAAGESGAAHSEAVGDKSRYRSWLGLKDPSPQREPSSDEEDDFDYDKLDDPPVIEGLDIKEECEKVDEKGHILEKGASVDGDDGETDGKIRFRSSKVRKEQPLFNKSRLKAKERFNIFGRKDSDRKGKVREEGSDEDDKLFEEWRSERKTRNNKSEDESELALESEVVESMKAEKVIEEKEKVKLFEERGDGDSRKINLASSDDLRERYFQSQSKEGLIKNEKKEKKEEAQKYRSKDRENLEKKKGDYSTREDNSTDRNSSAAFKERNKYFNENLKEGKERGDEKEECREYRERRRGDREDISREKMDSSFRERREDDNWKERKRQDERDRVTSEDMKDKYVDSRNFRRSEDERRFHKDKEREDYRDTKVWRREEDDHRDESLNRSNRDRHTGSRRTGIPDYIRKHDDSSKNYERAPARKLEGFRKPEDDLNDSSKSLRHDILGDANVFHGSSSIKNWKKKEFCKPEEKKELEQKQQTPSVAPKSLPTIQPSQVKEKDEEKLPDLQMSDDEMNALGAKALKAELLGNQTLAAKLKVQLEQARAARMQRKEAAATATTNKSLEEETIILTHRDSKGFVRPIGAPSHPEPSGGRRRPQKVTTHGADGLRERFFPDDDKYTLENMFQKEKMTTMGDVNEEFCRLAAKSSGRADSEYDLDDIFAENASREKAPGKLQALERNRAIQQHKQVERSLDSCTHCFDSPKMLKHLMIALGSKVYLSLPAHQSLTEGHCLLSPIHHVPCATQLDEDVWEEMTSFRKALVAMFLEQDEDCVFFESAMHLRRFPHMVLECVPVQREIGDTAPIYFKKAIMESEAEWSMNKKLVELKGKGVRRAVPKGLPYFAVDFGNDDGFAHVIEDEKLFPDNFAQEIIGGMLDLDHSLWRKQRRENFDSQRKKVVQFAEMWKKYDITNKNVDSSSSSSESDE